MRKVKWNLCHTYRVNWLLKQDENRNVATLNIGGVPFGGKKLIEY